MRNINSVNIENTFKNMYNDIIRLRSLINSIVTVNINITVDSADMTEYYTKNQIESTVGTDTADLATAEYVNTEIESNKITLSGTAPVSVVSNNASLSYSKDFSLSGNQLTLNSSKWDTKSKILEKIQQQLNSGGSQITYSVSNPLYETTSADKKQLGLYYDRNYFDITEGKLTYLTKDEIDYWEYTDINATYSNSTNSRLPLIIINSDPTNTYIQISNNTNAISKIYTQGNSYIEQAPGYYLFGNDKDQFIKIYTDTGKVSFSSLYDIEGNMYLSSAYIKPPLVFKDNKLTIQYDSSKLNISDSGLNVIDPNSIITSRTITHDTKPEESIENYELGKPCFMTGNVYRRKDTLWIDYDIDNTNCIPGCKSTGNWNEFLGIITKIDSYNDVVQFASHGDYIVYVDNSSLYSVSDIITYDGSIISIDSIPTLKQLACIVGRITKILDEHYVAIFKD